MTYINSWMGVYSVSADYTFLLNQFWESSPNSSWSWIWKANIPEKAKILVWQSLHNAFASNEFMLHYHLASSSACPSYNNEIESPLHCMRDCLHSKEISTTYCRKAETAAFLLYFMKRNHVPIYWPSLVSS
ncbi:hypothetical protein VNO78_27446 [Psophocarpus tetragonolobus]|uniref:Reverse transcriptase zinc-binding domain-containing protein n=1 Tax=Psophocarpus tetragonolobus TaxID=3891 RepID=A0AAN9S157_PSOTE